MNVRQYRANRRLSFPKVIPWWLHLMVLSAFGVLGVALGFSFIQNLKFIEFLMIPIAFIISNLVEYLLHRFPMHKALIPFQKLYKTHSGDHHVYFTDEYMNIENPKDMFAIFTKFRVILVFMGLVVIPGFMLFSWIWSANAGGLFFAIALGYYVFYEWVHFATHLPKSSWLSKIPYVINVRKRHQIHHNTKLMHRWNFNVVSPIFDKLFGTHYRQ